MSLRVEFRGWFLMRLATDPDPYDEWRGASGYTFAFGNEPNLDRILRFQPPEGLLRSQMPPDNVGVTVSSAHNTDGQQFNALNGAKLDLLNAPLMENRNRVLTAPGFEPIVPFHPRIESDGASVVITRWAWLDVDHPALGVTEVSSDVLSYRGAKGYDFHPDRVQDATGRDVRDYRTIVDGIIKPRLKALAAEEPADENQRAVRDGRMAELQIAVDEADDRRAMAHQGLEHFEFDFYGPSSVMAGNGRPLDDAQQEELLGGRLDTRELVRWRTEFDLLGWDADLLCGFATGYIEIPYARENRPPHKVTA